MTNRDQTAALALLAQQLDRIGAMQDATPRLGHEGDPEAAARLLTEAMEADVVLGDACETLGFGAGCDVLGFGRVAA